MFVLKIEKIFNNFKNYVSENLKDSSKFIYHVDHSIVLEGNENFKI